MDAREDHLYRTRHTNYPWSWTERSNGEDSGQRLFAPELHLFFDALLSQVEFRKSGPLVPTHLYAPLVELKSALFQGAQGSDQGGERFQNDIARNINIQSLVLASALITQSTRPIGLENTTSMVIDLRVLNLEDLLILCSPKNVYVVSSPTNIPSGEISYEIPECLLNYLGASFSVHSEVLGQIPAAKVIDYANIEKLFRQLDTKQQEFVLVSFIANQILPIVQEMIEADFLMSMDPEAIDYLTSVAEKDLQARMKSIVSSMERPVGNSLDSVSRIIGSPFMPLGPHSSN